MSFNCAKCPGYCCSHGRIAVSDSDVSRLAGHFGISIRAAAARLTYVYRAGAVEERILRHHKDKIYTSICHLFDRKTRQCTVYAARPNVCRKYPYGDTCGYYNFLKFERTFHDDKDFIPSA